MISFLDFHVYFTLIFRLNNAVDLVTLYVNEHSDSVTSQMVREGEMNMRQALFVSNLNMIIVVSLFFLVKIKVKKCSFTYHSFNVFTFQLYLQNEDLLNEVKPYLSSLTKNLDSSFNLSTTSDMSSPLMTSSFVN